MNPMDTELYKRIPIIHKERLAFIDRELEKEKTIIGTGLIKISFTDTKNNRIFRLELVDSCMIGRRPDLCDVVLDYDRTVSSTHCKLTVLNGAIHATNLSTTNPTYRNNKILDEMQVLQDGDILGMGRVDLQVHFG